MDLIVQLIDELVEERIRLSRRDVWDRDDTRLKQVQSRLASVLAENIKTK